jgi:pyruvate formate lyase activating enzyme
MGSHGIVFDIKHFAVHDGPGIRTTVFLKGCPLRCKWCHSPESQSFEREIMVNREECIACGACVTACPSGAMRQPGEISSEICSRCFKCVDECYSGALKVVGYKVTPDEVLREVERDRLLHDASGGGVTISGGEPTAQPVFLRRLVDILKENDLHVALDTCGHAPWRVLKSVAPKVDLFLYDLKHMDSGIHEELTGRGNGLILSNLKRLAQIGTSSIRIRVPLIPRINDSERNLDEMAGFIGRLSGVDAVDLLPYHRMGVPKYDALGRKYELSDIDQYEVGRLMEIKRYLSDFGLNVVLEGV